MATDVRAELDAERAHLLRARTDLAAMRARAEALVDAGGDAFASEALGLARRRRVAQLADDGATPLFFGRLDYAPAGGTHHDGRTFHVGRLHVADERGDPVVVDWRAPVSLPFYRATPADPLGLARRRRFGYAAGVLTGFEDERLDRGEYLGTASQILVEEIERPRVGPMRDIVATIQPDQDEIVRAGLGETVCVQGAPGTGKTAVGLHRAAYLLYTHRERLRREGVLVVGPSRAFLAYVGDVLPALGELDVRQVTVDEVPGRVPVRAADAPDAARLKGDARLAEVLRRAVYAGVRPPAEALVVPVGTRRWRVPAHEAAALVDGLLATRLRYDAARERLRLLLAEAVRRRMEESGEAPDDRDLARIAGSRPVRHYVDGVWPAVRAAALVARLLSDPAALAAAAGGVLDAAERRMLCWPAARAPATARWSAADGFLVDEVAGLLDRTPGFGHVVVDEAQDLSPMQCRALGRRCALGAATLLGDIAQGTTPWATASWAETLGHLGKPDGRVETLTAGYRVPRDVLDFANRLLPAIAPGLPAATSVRRAGGGLSVRRVPEAELERAVTRAVERLLGEEGSLAVVAADARAARLAATLQPSGRAIGLLGRDAAVVERVEIVPASAAKGLEFDSVVVVEPVEIAAAEERGLRRLYVVLTRAVSRLVVVHAAPLPPPLGPAAAG